MCHTCERAGTQMPAVSWRRSAPLPTWPLPTEQLGDTSTDSSLQILRFGHINLGIISKYTYKKLEYKLERNIYKIHHTAYYGTFTSLKLGLAWTTFLTLLVFINFGWLFWKCIMFKYNKLWWWINVSYASGNNNKDNLSYAWFKE